MEITQFIRKTLEGASDIARDKFGKVSGTTKQGDPNQVLTEADLALSKYLTDAINEVYPEDNLIDEEAGAIDRGSSRTWVLDPIDGTSNFAEGVPTCGILIGLLEGEIPVAGGIALPSFQEIYVAERGKGAKCNGETIHVTDREDLLSVLVSYGIDGNQEDPEATRKEGALLAELALCVRNLRTSNSVFDSAMVARGKYGGIMYNTAKIWDFVAPQIILLEAGAKCTDLVGETVDYGNALARADENFTFCAAPPVLHEKLQSIIRSALD